MHAPPEYHDTRTQDDHAWPDIIPDGCQKHIFDLFRDLGGDQKCWYANTGTFFSATHIGGARWVLAFRPGQYTLTRDGSYVMATIGEDSVVIVEALKKILDGAELDIVPNDTARLISTMTRLPIWPLPRSNCSDDFLSADAKSDQPS